MNNFGLKDIIEPIALRAETLLSDDFGIQITSVGPREYPSKLEMKDHMSMIGTGGKVSIFLVVGYDNGVLDQLVKIFLEGEEADESELAEIRESVAGEVVNIVIGNALPEFPHEGKGTTITPPVMINNAQSISQYKDSEVISTNIETEFGQVFVTIIGSRVEERRIKGAVMLNILVVDDSIIIRKNLTKLFEKMGHKVHQAGNGQQAVEKYRELKPDLVTMDITMPEMNGIEATRKIVDEFPDAKIVMVTSHGMEDMVIDSIDAGAMGYVLKPITEAKLLEQMAKALPNLK